VLAEIGKLALFLCRVFSAACAIWQAAHAAAAAAATARLLRADRAVANDNCTILDSD
jgi:hypothetical protein